MKARAASVPASQEDELRSLRAQLAAAGYTITWFTLANVILVQGFSAAVNALGANAFGAGNLRLLGYFLQIGWSFVTAGALVIGGVTYFAGDVMQMLVGFDGDMKALVSSFSRVTLIGFLPLAWSNLLNSWLLAQKVVAPQLFTYVSCVGGNLGLNIVFIYGVGSWPGLGFLGSALATAVSRWLQFFAMVCFSCAHQRRQRATRHVRDGHAPTARPPRLPRSVVRSRTCSRARGAVGAKDAPRVLALVEREADRRRAVVVAAVVVVVVAVSGS